jgi:hypothetical protein
MPQEVTIQQEWYQAIISRPSFQSWLKDVALMHSDLESQWNAFVRKALANGYKYLDWYSAFQNWLTSPYQHQQNGRMATQPYQSVDELKQILDEDDAWRKTL